jgi:hypothetical protein
MIDTVLGLLFIILAVLTVVGVDRSLRAGFVRSTKAGWKHEGYTIQWSLDNCLCYGTRPTSTYRDMVFGVLAVADGTVLFKGRLTANCNTKIPIDEIYGLGLCTIHLRRGNSLLYQVRTVVEIHTVEWGEWQVYTFQANETARAALCNAIQSQRAYSIPERSTDQQMTATRANLMTQDVYGEWHEEDSGDLYLAPDRIIYGWQVLLLFSAIRRIAVVEHGGLNPFAQNLVRIDYEDTQMRTLGFLMRGAEEWAEMLSRVIDVPVESQSGRKKKEHG